MRNRTHLIVLASRRVAALRWIVGTILYMRAALCALFIIAAPASATEISFYYPVAVGGPVAKIVASLVADFEKENPDIRVKPIYVGTYKEALVKALTAHKSGAPPDVAVLFAVDMYTLIDADAIVAFDDLAVAAQQDKSWLDRFYPALMANCNRCLLVTALPISCWFISDGRRKKFIQFLAHSRYISL